MYNHYVKDNNECHKEDSRYESNLNNVKLVGSKQINIQISEENITFGERFMYEVDLKSEDNSSMVENTSQDKFSKIKARWIKNPHSEIDCRFENLQKRNFPYSIKEFYVDWDGNRNSMSNYMNAFITIISWTTSQVFFDKPRMNYSEFSKIIKASRRVHTLIFSCLTLSESGTLDLGKNKNYRIKEFSLQMAGNENYSNWTSDRTGLYLIVDQIKKSNMHKKLEKFNINGCNTDLTEEDLPEVKIVHEWW